MNIYLWLSLTLFILALFLSRNRTRNKYSLFLGAFIIYLYILLTGAYVVADYFTGEGINDAVLYHLRYGLEGSGFGDYYLIMTIGFGFFIASFIIAYFYYRLLKNDIFPKEKRIRRILSTSLLIASIALHPTIVTFYGDVSEAVGIKNELSLQNNFADYYKTPTIQSISDEHPNLVYIFAESFETTYFDETLFPSLVTHLRSFKEQSTYFTDIRQVKGTSWTIAGATAVICGLPLVTPSSSSKTSQGNSMSKMDSFYSGATCMSDLLHKEGYRMVSRRGASLKFAGTDKLYRTHHFDDIKGLDELKPLLKNQSYQTAWGLYDDTLFDIALNDFKKLSTSKRKFAMFISTMDTHHPSGHVSKSCEHNSYQDGSNSMLNAVYCSDELITKFIKNIQESPYGKNTVIVVASDHLAMHNLAIDTLNKGERRDQLMILDPRRKSENKVEKMGSTLDISTTLLPFLGYKADVGLSRNLLSDDKSLVQVFDDFDEQLDAWTKDISKFWEFPKVEDTIALDANTKGFKIGKTFYRYPILLRISDTLEVNPFFEVKLKYFETPKLFDYLKDFQADDTFLWVDKCSRIAVLGEKVDENAKLCYALGTLGSPIESGNLTKIQITLEHLNRIIAQNSSEEEATHKRKVLSDFKEK
ncbi:MAG: sulfatase-like hydrolase/transferase [Sulfurospirillaceae bacterium]|nr:sulfatase-like hydrolase/transferase [Sulfurospirillaceae bacterium]MDD2825757.1 sulfatase-like hydrolase/transferase [Sulfurospirillaceae bacterium]